MRIWPHGWRLRLPLPPPRTQDGGAVLGILSVSAQNSSFANCTAAQRGGAIYSNQSVSVTGSSFARCAAAGGSGGGIFVGAFASRGPLGFNLQVRAIAISSSVFSVCTAAQARHRPDQFLSPFCACRRNLRG